MTDLTFWAIAFFILFYVYVGFLVIKTVCKGSQRACDKAQDKIKEMRREFNDDV